MEDPVVNTLGNDASSELILHAIQEAIWRLSQHDVHKSSKASNILNALASMSIKNINEIASAIKLLEEYINELNAQLEIFYKIMEEEEGLLERLEVIKEHIKEIAIISKDAKRYYAQNNIDLTHHPESLKSLKNIDKEVKSIDKETAKDIKTLKVLQGSYSKDELALLTEHHKKYKKSMSELLQKVNGISNKKNESTNSRKATKFEKLDKDFESTRKKKADAWKEEIKEIEEIIKNKEEVMGQLKARATLNAIINLKPSKIIKDPSKKEQTLRSKINTVNKTDQRQETVLTISEPNINKAPPPKSPKKITLSNSDTGFNTTAAGA